MAQEIAIDQAKTEGVRAYNRYAMAHASRLISPCIAGASAIEQLYSIPAAWGIHPHVTAEATALVPKLQSPRRRGIAPPYPRKSLLADLREGTLILFSSGFVLEPADGRHPCVNVARSSVTAATFYSDAFDVALDSRERIVVRTASVERVEAIFQAFFWNSMR